MLPLFICIEEETERRRRKKSRWGGTENDKTFIPGMPTILPPTLDPKQQEAYLGNFFYGKHWNNYICIYR